MQILFLFSISLLLARARSSQLVNFLLKVSVRVCAVLFIWLRSARAARKRQAIRSGPASAISNREEKAKKSARAPFISNSQPQPQLPGQLASG